LAHLEDNREVIPDPNALYSGAKINDRTLVPENNAQLGETRYEAWLNQQTGQAARAKSQPAA
jgi:hypothetical protein